MHFKPNSPEARDISYHMHGNTNARRHEEIGPMIIEKGEGIYVEDSNGKKYIEALAGLWSVGVGFSEQRLVDAAVKQMKKLPYYHNFTHKSHSPAIELAEKLVNLAPVPMSKAFFTNSGSEANDTVIKMVWYRANAMGQPRKKKIIARRKGYHGVTVASGSLTGLPANQISFDLPIANIMHTSSPHYWRDAAEGESEEQFATRLAKELETLILSQGPDTIAAFIGEPVMGAGGVITPPKTYWEKIQAVLKKYDILLIADEVICGFGRTGKMFGSETYSIKPDIMVMSKQISSSYMPISAFLINDKVYNPIADESNRLGTFGHGFTAGGHPVAAAVAVENIKIIEERKLIDNASNVGAYMQKKLRELSDHPLVGEVRGVGLIAAIELVADKAKKLPLNGKVGALGAMMNQELVENGVISRNMGDALAFCPPMIITKQQIDDLVNIVSRSLDVVSKQLKP
ncbi:aspartate aminotransferase family protein [Bartonella sp. M0187]|uniref:aspartate aminotransferase family protein n=1 Tax=Bartonella apihabitans TaxID=2750929 RepID=UPI0018DE08A3|nr:aspartate aminotransferase family protein [Bartonella apihabitans]MBI0025027.1 aspartate aminotransferase family protein [Bartonella apihabitans]